LPASQEEKAVTKAHSLSKCKPLLTFRTLHTPYPNHPLPCSSRFVVIVSCIAIVFALVFFAVGITSVYKGNPDLTVTFAVSILVAFVPEGLPSVVTLLLSIAAKRMAKQNVLVKDLQGVETLGMCSSPYWIVMYVLLIENFYRLGKMQIGYFCTAATQTHIASSHFWRPIKLELSRAIK
jgi:hypothetical protein